MKATIEKADYNQHTGTLIMTSTQTIDINNGPVKGQESIIYGTVSTDEGIQKGILIKSKACQRALELMDKDYEYREAIILALSENPDQNPEDLAEELNLYI